MLIRFRRAPPLEILTIILKKRLLIKNLIRLPPPWYRYCVYDVPYKIDLVS